MEALISAGIVEDLSGHEIVMAHFSHLYPRVQEALTKDGKVYALPQAVFPGQNPLVAMGEDKWQQLGWHYGKTPATFAELCALAEEYMSLPLSTRRGTRLLGDGNTAAASRRVLLSELVNLAYSEAMAQGDISQLDTLAFREALTQLQSAYKALSKKQASVDAKGSVYGLIWDGGQSYMDYPGDKQLHLRLGSTPAFAQRLGVAVVNANSNNKAAALHFMEWLSGNISAQFLPELNGSLTAQEIGRMKVAQEIAGHSEKSYVEAGGQQGDEEQLERLKGMLASGDYGYYAPDEQALARFRADVAPNMTIIIQEYPVTDGLQNDYLSGRLDADAFIQALQEAAENQ